MEKKRTPLYVPTLWCFTTACWLVVLILDISHGCPSIGLTLLRALTFCASLYVAISNIIRYRAGRSDKAD